MMKNIYGIDEHRQPDSALSGRENSGTSDPGLAPRRWGSAAPAPGCTLEPLRGSDSRTASLSFANELAHARRRRTIHLSGRRTAAQLNAVRRTPKEFGMSESLERPRGNRRRSSLATVGVAAVMFVLPGSPCEGLVAGPGSPVPTSGVSELHVNSELLIDFQKSVCAGQTPTADLWARHEARNQATYERLIYDSLELRELQTQLVENPPSSPIEACANAGMFTESLAAVLPLSYKHVVRETGIEPSFAITLVAPLLTTDARALGGDSATLLVLNATLPALRSRAALSRLLEHELLHAVQKTLHGRALHELPVALRALYEEGMAMYGGSLLSPQTPLTILDLRGERLGVAESVGSQLLATICPAINGPAQQDELYRRYFVAGNGDAAVPDRSGYLAGLRAFETLARRVGTSEALLVSPRTFLKEICGGSNHE